MSARVDIITAAYNQAGYIRTCIESVLAQTVQDWRMFVVDDGSTDGTADVAASYGDPRITVIRLPHRGLESLAESYNAAFGQGSAPLVAILEGDDAWGPDKLALHLPVFDDGDVALSWGAALLIDENDRTTDVFRSMPEAREPMRLTLAELFRMLVIKNVITPTVTVICRRTALDAVGGFSQLGTRNYVDYPTWLAMCADADGAAVYLHDVLGLYRVHSAQTTQKKRLQMVEDYHTSLTARIALMTPEQRKRVEWTAAMEKAARVQSAFVLGGGCLHVSRFDEARRHYGDALRHAPWRRKPHALVGYAGAVVHRDLIEDLRRIRDRRNRDTTGDNA